MDLASTSSVNSKSLKMLAMKAVISISASLLPRHSLGPALKAVNTKLEGLFDISSQRSGRKTIASSPQRSVHRP